MPAAAPQTVPGFFLAAFERYGDRPILEDRDGTVGLGQVLSSAAAIANALARRGLARGDRVAFWADNSRRWIPVDLAIQLAGAIDVPRGTDTPDDEACELFAHAEVSIAFVHDAKTARRLEAQRPRLPSLRDVFVLDPAGAAGTTVDALVAEAAPGPTFAERTAALSPDDVATIIYTSGTTGRPKGVVLTHANFAHQISTMPKVLGIGPSDVFLSFLPPWHIFERTVEYVALTQGARLVYTDVRRLKPDLAARSPTFVPSVPRVWEVVHDAVRKAVLDGGAVRRALFAAAYEVGDRRARALDFWRGHVIRTTRPRGRAAAAEDAFVRHVAGAFAALLWPVDAVLKALVFARIRAITGGRLRGAVVGGGLMPAHVDRFFRAAGLGVLVGYGLTETSPVLTVRRERRNVIGTIGTAVPGVEISIRDRETGRPLPPGETGVVFTRGPQVMRGYHKDPELTAKVLSADGWFDTGDLGMLTVDGDLCFRGRQKETIVLLGGENVEPTRVEERILPSPLVDQAIVVGQDRKTLAALVVPREEEVRARLSLGDDVPASSFPARDDVVSLVREEVARRTGAGSGLKPFEVVSRVVVLPEPMTPENGLLTATRKPRRHVLAERFAAEIEAAYA
jgi:long-chain acyl-CoA synthetase